MNDKFDACPHEWSWHIKRPSIIRHANQKIPTMLRNKIRPKKIKGLFALLAWKLGGSVGWSFFFFNLDTDEIQGSLSIQFARVKFHWNCSGGGGGTDLERGYGDVQPWRPLFTPLLAFARVPFQAKESVHKTPFEKIWKF